MSSNTSLATPIKLDAISKIIEIGVVYKPECLNQSTLNPLDFFLKKKSKRNCIDEEGQNRKRKKLKPSSKKKF